MKNKPNHSGSGRRYQPRATERTRSSPAGGQQTTPRGPTGIAGLATENPAGFARNVAASGGPFGAARPQLGFAAAMARGSRSRPDSESGRSSTLDAVLRTGRLKLRNIT